MPSQYAPSSVLPLATSTPTNSIPSTTPTSNSNSFDAYSRFAPPQRFLTPAPVPTYLSSNIDDSYIPTTSQPYPPQRTPDSLNPQLSYMNTNNNNNNGLYSSSVGNEPSYLNLPNSSRSNPGQQIPSNLSNNNNNEYNNNFQSPVPPVKMSNRPRTNSFNAVYNTDDVNKFNNFDNNHMSPHRSSVPQLPSQDLLLNSRTISNGSLENQLATERNARIKLEEREIEHVKNISQLEERIRYVDNNHNHNIIPCGSGSENEEQLRTIISTQQIEIDNLRKTIENYKKKITTLSSGTSTLLEKEKVANFKIDELTSQLTALKFEHDPNLNDNDVIPGSLKGFTIADLKTSLENTKKELDVAIKEKVTISVLLNEKINEMEILKRQQASINPEIKQRIDTLEAVQRSLRDQLIQRDNELKQAKDSLMRESNMRSQLTQEIHTLKSKFEIPAPRKKIPDIKGRPLPTQPLLRPKGVDADLWDLFVSVDPYQLKIIGPPQLLTAINRGPWPDLDIRAITALSSIVENEIGVDFEGFCTLWGYLSSWVPIFRSYDNHQAEKEFAYLPRKELRKILKECKIPVSERYLTLLFQSLELDQNLIGWNTFNLIAAKGKFVAEQFVSRDMDRDNWVTLNYDQFLELMASCAGYD